jgi:membrane protease YdiL (CAAX protease family)
MTRPLLTFFSLTFAATWICWAATAAILAVGAADAPVPAALGGGVFLLGVFAPGLVAAALTHRSEGRAATRALLGRVVLWRVPARWYVFAIAYIPAIELSAALAHRLAAGTWPRFGQTPWYAMAVALLVSTWAQAGEEVGWRGYALPRLAVRFGAAAGSVVLGIVWALWHLPLFFVLRGDTLGQSFPLYLLQVTAISVAAAWVYWRTGGSLLLVMLLHAAVNNTKDIVVSAVPGATNPWALSTSLAAWFTVALLWIPAAYFLVRMRGIRSILPAPGTR